eukprot:m.124760 g.124760  ORF g.124760 m.124760 type:complete len:205 (-) comp52187_c0_seq2:274-888(-)
MRFLWLLSLVSFFFLVGLFFVLFLSLYFSLMRFGRICEKCNAPKPIRTHHCSTCRKCVLDMDHHCPFIASCVGRNNYRHFFLFVVYCWFATVYATWLSAQPYAACVTASDVSSFPLSLAQIHLPFLLEKLSVYFHRIFLLPLSFSLAVDCSASSYSASCFSSSLVCVSLVLVRLARQKSRTTSVPAGGPAPRGNSTMSLSSPLS